MSPQHCCNDCCVTKLSTCLGFAYSDPMGCLEAMRVRAVAGLVFGVHALCGEVTAVTEAPSTDVGNLESN